MRRPEVAAKLRGPGNGKYSPIPNYGSLHDRLDHQRGLATSHKCEVCGNRAKNWALSHEAEEVVTNTTEQRYSLALSDYFAMCVPCHRRYDYGSLWIAQ